jgi:hypothetical protein
MTRDSNPWVILALGALLGLGWGMAGLMLWDRGIDRDRAVYMDVIEINDRRVGYDVAAEHATIIQPKEVKE